MSIEWAMWFALGFLAAGILALLVMGAVWRRAVRLTARRMAARVPAGVDDVLAEKDLLRARHARDQRRMELALADLRRRHADERLAVGRGRVEIEAVRDALAAETGARAAAEAREAGLAATLETRDRRIDALETDLRASLEDAASLREIIVERDDGIKRLIEEHRRAVTDAATAHEEATATLIGEHEATVSAFEDELARAGVEAAARKTTLAANEAQIRSLRLQAAEVAAKFDASETARGLAEAAAAQERDRADRLDRRIERLVADVAAREDMADRRGRELDRAREALVFANARVAALTSGTEGAPPTAGDNLLRSLAQVESRNRELEEKLAALAGGAATPAQAGVTAGPGDAATRAALRDSLADLAAEIVHLTRLAEGPTSPIDRIVAAPEAGEGEAPSLAARIRRLRRQAAEAGAAGPT